MMSEAEHWRYIIWTVGWTVLSFTFIVISNRLKWTRLQELAFYVLAFLSVWVGVNGERFGWVIQT